MPDPLQLRGNGSVTADSCSVCPMRAELINRAQEAILDRNALTEEVTSLTRRLAHAKAELTRQRTHHPLAPMVAAWLDYWQARLSNGKADVSPGGDRWARALKAMQRKHAHAEAQGIPNPAEWALSELKLAVDGLVLSAWHMGENPKRKRFTKVENVLKDDEITDDFIEAGRRAQAEPVEIPLRWLSPEARDRVRSVPWLLPVLRDALDASVEWCNELEQELLEFREFRAQTVLEVVAA